MAKILLVEDDNNLREIYEARLMAEGYDIVSARDGEEALTVAMKERPDLIISDVMMPKISGFDMLDIIRSTEETKNAKVIMMTALSQAEDKERAAKLGADRYLVKSQVTLEDVAKVAREVLAGESSTPAGPSVTPPAVTQAPTAPAPEPTAPVTASPTPVTPTPATPVVEPPSTVAVDNSTSDDDQSTPSLVTVQPSVTTSTAVDEPVAAPVTVDNSDDISSTDSAKDIAAKAMEAIMPETATDNSVVTPDASDDEEQSAIAAQIESFIETNKSDATESATVVTPPAENAVVTPAESPATSEPSSTEDKPKKKIIQPISDPNESKGPDLENLLKKEEEKQEMQEIARAVAAENSSVADERVAESALKKAAANAGNMPAEETESDTPQVSITENGELKVVSEPNPVAETPTPEPKVEETSLPEPIQAETTAPVIPHQNGSSIDGVMPQTVQAQAATEPQPTQPVASAPQPAENDPNAIAL